MRTVGTVLALAATLPANADTSDAFIPTPEVTTTVERPRTFVNLRAGATTFSMTRPEICLEGEPLAFLGLEACGTGSGFLHRSPDPELAHFRSKLRLFGWNLSKAWIEPQLTLGFAELQVGEDASGFDFGGVGPLGNETAGPEAGLGVRGVLPAGAGFEWIGELQLSGAWLPHAGALSRPMSTFQPSASFSLGIGF